MTLMDLLTEALLRQMPLDKRLLDLDIRILVLLHAAPPSTVREISQLLGPSPETVRRSINRLVDTGWMLKSTEKQGREALFDGSVPLSIETEIANKLKAIRLDISNLGEWLMFCWLDLLITCLNFISNARPDWLRTHQSNTKLEIDRGYHQARVGFEFNGAQHFHAVGPYANDSEGFQKQADRDSIKIGICVQNDYPLIVIVKEDLSLAGMLAKMPPDIPKAMYREKGPIVKALTDMSTAYISYRGTN